MTSPYPKISLHNLRPQSCLKQSVLYICKSLTFASTPAVILSQGALKDHMAYIKCTSNVPASERTLVLVALCNKKKLPMKLPSEARFAKREQSSSKRTTEKNSESISFAQLRARTKRKVGKAEKSLSLSRWSKESQQSSMDGRVNTTGSLLYGYNSSSSILGLRAIDYSSKLNNM